MSSGDRRRDPGRARPGPEGAGPVRHARHPGGAAGRGPRRDPRARRVPPGAVRGRARPPRRRQDHPADQGRPLPGRGHARRTSTSATTPSCPPPRSATWSGWSSSRPGRGSLPTGRSGSARATWPPRWATRPAAAATTSPSPPAPGCWPQLAGGHADRSFDARVRKLAKITVLICDDFAMREFTAAQADDLYELLTERVGRPGRSLILTSNRSPVGLVPAVPQRGRRRVDPGPGPQHQPPPAAGRQELPSPAPPRPGQARPCRPAPAMTRRWRLRRRSPPGGCRARAGGRAAQGYGAAPPASRLLRIANATAPVPQVRGARP